MRVNVREYEKIISEDVLILINNFIFHTPIVIDDTFKIIFHGNAIPSNPYLTAFRTDEYRFQHQHGAPDVFQLLSQTSGLSLTHMPMPMYNIDS